VTKKQLLAGAYSDTWALAPRRGLPFPLVVETAWVARAELRERLESWTKSYLYRGPPWQDVIEHTFDASFPTLVLERFVGVTFADVVRNLADQRWILPAGAWTFASQQLFRAAERAAESWLREPPCPQGIGWSLTGELVLAPLSLNSIWASEVDVSDHTVCFAPEHLAGASLTERTVVFQLAVLLTWLSCGEHPLGPDKGGHVEALLHAHRAWEPAWKRSVEPRLIPVLERALAHAPAERYPTLDAFQQALVAESDPAMDGLSTFGVLHAVTHRIVDRLLEDLWARDTLLPSSWDGLWPDGLHPLEGLSVVEDRLLERRADRRAFREWTQPARTPREWKTPQQRTEESTAIRRATAGRWWVVPIP
jgi:hypothetical protein